MSKARMYGMNSRCVPNRDADRRCGGKQFQQSINRRDRKEKHDLEVKEYADDVMEKMNPETRLDEFSIDKLNELFQDRWRD